MWYIKTCPRNWFLIKIKHFSFDTYTTCTFFIGPVVGFRYEILFFLWSYRVFIHPSRDGAVLCDWVWRVGVHTGFRTITLVLYIGSLPNLATWFPCGRGRTLFILGSKVKVTITINIIVDKRSFLHDNFSSVYWIFSKLGHMISLWKGKNPIYFEVIRSKVKVTYYK
jgi:tetrahydromethanopterin S-methyltransferase subunit E